MKTRSDSERGESERGRRGAQIEQLIDRLILSEPVLLSARTRSAERARLSRRRRVKAGVALAILVVVFFSAPIVSSEIIGSHGCGTSSPASQAMAQKRIALIDELAWQFPNPQFVETLGSSANESGYGFDYYPPSAPTIDFYTHLPQLGYSMVILRAHGSTQSLGDNSLPPSVATSENYSRYSHWGDQLTGQVGIMDVDGTRFFSMTPSFISHEMCGRFQNTLVIAMWCTGGRWMELASAFVQKGARAFVGWDGPVTLNHTDLVLEYLVRLLVKGTALPSAIQDAMIANGPDPQTGAQLIYSEQ